MALAPTADRPDAFISYARADQDCVTELVAYLDEHDVEVWIDSAIDHGTSWPRVRDRVDGCAALVVVMTPTSEDSEWMVRRKVALRRGPRRRRPSHRTCPHDLVHRMSRSSSLVFLSRYDEALSPTEPSNSAQTADLPGTREGCRSQISAATTLRLPTNARPRWVRSEFSDRG